MKTINKSKKYQKNRNCVDYYGVEVSTLEAMKLDKYIVNNRETVPAFNTLATQKERQEIVRKILKIIQ